MDNKTFNDCMIVEAVRRMVSQGYANSVDDAKEWLVNRGTKPMFMPSNKSFSELGAVKTLERVCVHAYEIISYRRSGYEIELPARVKAYYTPRFENMSVKA